MRMGVSVLFALRLMGIGSRLSLSNARKSLIGAVAGIGISLVPLIAVLVVADGMIEGISGRIIELSSAICESPIIRDFRRFRGCGRS